VPLLTGGSSEAALRRVARWADGWAVPTLTSAPDSIPQALAARDRLHRICEVEDRDPASLRLLGGVDLDADAGLDALAELGVEEVDLMLREPADLDLERPARRLEELRARYP
jgi:alkanesulfonate monooxygenase SsuD/methylene tetrahydromethanopterin reductase-like flavin-dependent oxidoreductase (luciferase family)